MMKRLIMSILVITGLLGASGTLRAQVPYQRYAPPSGPTLPYYLDYFRPQSGVLDQYNQFVAPKARMSNDLRTIVQQQNTDFGTLESQIKKSSQIRRSGAAPTGTAAGFMNYSHFYPAPSGGAGTQTRTSPSMPRLR